MFLNNGRKPKKEVLLEELAKMPTMVIATAYLYARNFNDYGVNVAEKWLTAVQNTINLERAYRKGYCDAMNSMIIESEDKE